jgi:Kef-type K+ transport system membrane component KefB
MIHTFSPLFFVMVGVSLDLNRVNWHSSYLWALAGVLLLAAFVGKFAAGFFIAEPWRRRTAVGLAMIPRGEVGLIFAQLGYNQKILPEEMYAALLIVIALTTLAPPFLLKGFYAITKPTWAEVYERIEPQ